MVDGDSAESVTPPPLTSTGVGAPRYNIFLVRILLQLVVLLEIFEFHIFYTPPLLVITGCMYVNGDEDKGRGWGSIT